jgi:hypothetical protein
MANNDCQLEIYDNERMLEMRIRRKTVAEEERTMRGEIFGRELVRCIILKEGAMNSMYAGPSRRTYGRRIRVHLSVQ